MQASERSSPLVLIVALAIATVPAVCPAQEVSSIDLTDVVPRTDLRLPALKDGEPSGRRSNMHETHQCGPSNKNAGALKTTLVSLDRTAYQIGDQPMFQVQIKNVGSVVIMVPFSPNLADLQPADPSQKFAYSRMVVELWFGGARWSANTGGMVTLYGDDNHSGTMLTLRPGEWMRISGKGNITLPQDFTRLTASGDTVSQSNARASIYRDETLLTAIASATASKEVCLTQTHGSDLPIQIREK